MSTTDPVKELVDILRQALQGATSASHAASAPSPPAASSPVATLAPYSGLAEECNGFLLQCSLALEMQSARFPTERAKIAYIITLLKGRALQWAHTIWEQNGVATLTLSNFINHFREVFGTPVDDSSVGERLYHLSQNNLSVSEYALQFRTLAAASGWNERSLLTTYRQGLHPRVRLQLAADDDTMGLERFIQLSIRTDRRMQPCLEATQGHAPSYHPRQPGYVSSPEPEPMQVESNRLTGAERQRRLTQGLCLYCGARGHVIAACPTRPPRSMVSALRSHHVSSKPLTTEVILTASDLSISVRALLDSGSAGNFLSDSLCRQLDIKKRSIPTQYQIQAITGKPINRRNVRQEAGPLQLQLGLLHLEDITFLVLENSTADIILGRPWLEQHDPVISW
ncbi:MAG: DUF4939 domain-containing protein, partial [Plesiomonas shigelloides]